MEKENLYEELKKERIAKKESVEEQYSYLMFNVIEYFEKRRKELLKITKNPDKYSQKNVAEKAGISFATYKNYLSKKYNMSLMTFFALSDVLQCDPLEVIKSIKSIEWNW